jgi:hypothetical protein
VKAIEKENPAESAGGRGASLSRITSSLIKMNSKMLEALAWTSQQYPQETFEASTSRDQLRDK